MTADPAGKFGDNETPMCGKNGENGLTNLDSQARQCYKREILRVDLAGAGSHPALSYPAVIMMKRVLTTHRGRKTFHLGRETFVALVVRACCAMLMASVLAQSAFSLSAFSASVSVPRFSTTMEVEPAVEQEQGHCPAMKKPRNGRIQVDPLAWNRLAAAESAMAVGLAFYYVQTHIPPRERLGCNHHCFDGLGAPLLC